MMTATLDDVTKRKQAGESAEQQAARELVRMARRVDMDLLTAAENTTDSVHNTGDKVFTM